MYGYFFHTVRKRYPYARHTRHSYTSRMIRCSHRILLSFWGMGCISGAADNVCKLGLLTCRPVPAGYSSELRALVTSILQPDQARRPTIDQVLSNPILRSRAANFSCEEKPKHGLAQLDSPPHDLRYQGGDNQGASKADRNKRPVPQLVVAPVAHDLRYRDHMQGEFHIITQALQATCGCIFDSTI